jgi:hypothetical protein
MNSIKLALEMNRLVHNECKDVPHDIGLRLLNIVKNNTDTDMQEFAEWTSMSPYIYIERTESWANEFEPFEEDKTTAHLLQEFKDRKEGKND